MGRKSTGSVCVSQVNRLELSFLLKGGYLKYGYNLNSKIYWVRNGYPTGNVSIQCCYTNNEKWVRLNYFVGEKIFDYKIYLEEVDSNLGRGKVIYFLCPQSGKKCRILYIAYESDIFKSRQAYKDRLYYETQKCTKADYWNIRYFQLDNMINKLWDGQRTSIYKDSITKRVKRIQRLTNQKRTCNKNRWSELGMKKSFAKALRAVDNSNAC